MQEHSDENTDDLPQFEDSVFEEYHTRERTKAKKKQVDRKQLEPRWGERVPLEGGKAQLVKAQEEDPTLHECRQKGRNNENAFSYKNGVLTRTWRMGKRAEVEEVVLPRKYRETTLRMAHGSPFAGHFGRTNTAQRILKNFFWPGMNRDVADMCKQCHVCQTTARRRQPKYPLVPLPILTEPFSRIAMDVIGPLPTTDEGHRFVLTVMDYGTRYPEAFPLVTTTSQDVSEALTELFSRTGIPKEVLTDRGSNFCSEHMEKFFSLFGI